MGQEKNMVEDPIKKFLTLRRLNGDRVFYWKIHQNGGNIKGISDIQVVLNGQYVAIEAKAPGGRVSEEQRIFGRNVINAGGTFIVVDRADVFYEWYRQYSNKEIEIEGRFFNLSHKLVNV